MKIAHNSVGFITAAMVFQREMSDGMALSLGVIKFDQPYDISDQFHHLLDLSNLPCLAAVRLPLASEDKSMPYCLSTICEKLRGNFWNRLKNPDDHKITPVGLIPLVPEKGVYAFYSAMERSIFAVAGDSFHQYDGEWSTLDGYAKTNGSTPDQIFQMPIWDIDGQPYSIYAMSDAYLQYHELYTQVAIRSYQENLSASECEALVIAEIRAKMQPDQVPGFISMGQYRNNHYMSYLFELHRLGGTSVQRLSTKAQYENRISLTAMAMKACAAHE